jgi:hypothetical protein
MDLNNPADPVNIAAHYSSMQQFIDGPPKTNHTNFESPTAAWKALIGIALAAAFILYAMDCIVHRSFLRWNW